MKAILCYGDSNTWGYNPATQDRYPHDVRWTGVLQKTLGNGYKVIAEGLNGRTTVWDDPIEAYRNGKTYLIPCLDSHCPLDLVVILLGTNDLKKRFSLSAYDIARGGAVLVEVVQKSGAGPGGDAPPLLLLAPPPVGRLTAFAEMFEGAEAKSKLLGRHYRSVAEQYGCAFFDTSEVIVSSDVDGIHLDPGEHEKLGKAVAKHVQTLLPSAA